MAALLLSLACGDSELTFESFFPEYGSLTCELNTFCGANLTTSCDEENYEAETSGCHAGRDPSFAECLADLEALLASEDPEICGRVPGSFDEPPSCVRSTRCGTL